MKFPHPPACPFPRRRGGVAGHLGEAAAVAEEAEEAEVEAEAVASEV